MYASMLSAFERYVRDFCAPTQKFNQLAIAQMEKLSTIQMDSMKSSVNLGVAHMKAATEVSDPWSFIAYVAKQGSYMTKVGEQVIADATKIRALGVNFMDDAQAIAQEEARAISTAVGEFGKATPKKAA